MNDVLLRLEGVCKSFGAGEKRLHVLKSVDLSVQRGEYVAIVGPSGAGKSTLLHVACGLLRATSGTVWIGEKRLEDFSDADCARWRNRSIGFVFQLHHLLPEFSAVENVALPALVSGEKMEEAAVRAQALLADVGLDSRAWHRPGELSGGEQQRVAIARALVNGPDLLLADEPTGDLDAETASDIHDLLLRLNRETGQTLMLVTHNPELSQRADRVITLKDGKIEKQSDRSDPSDRSDGSDRF
jgi:lipoprotein-releasing system ATP-binding protein